MLFPFYAPPSPRVSHRLMHHAFLSIVPFTFIKPTTPVPYYMPLLFIPLCSPSRSLYAPFFFLPRISFFMII